MDQKDRKMKYVSRILSATLAAALLIPGCAGAEGEEPEAQATDPIIKTAEEEGLAEIQDLLDLNLIEQTEDMNLEEISDALANGAMSEFYNEETGFSVQYPATFQFQDGEEYIALSQDGKASIRIESIGNNKKKKLKNIAEMAKKEDPDCETTANEKAGLLKIKRTDKTASMIYVDLYLETGGWIHHVTMTYPADQDKAYDPFLDYMLNTMTSAESELG